MELFQSVLAAGKATELIALLGALLVTWPAVRLSLAFRRVSKLSKSIDSRKADTVFSAAFEEVRPAILEAIQTWKSSDHYCLVAGLGMQILASALRVLVT